MILTVVKRDGRIVGFNREKIAAAIRKAMLTTENGEDEVLVSKIVDRIEYRGKEQSSVEEIQDMVEFELMKSPRKEVAKSYIAYRDKRSIARKAKTREMFLEIVDAKSNDVTRENANMNADTPAGMMMKFSSETTKPFVDDYLLSEETLWAVRNNYLHIHDKDYYPTKSLTCIQHPLDKILENGFMAGHGESRPTKRIETASIMACISMETVQNEMHGGQAIPAFDFYLAPYVRKSYIEEVKNIENLTGADLKHLYNAPIEDYIVKDLLFMQGDERMKQHAINRTVNRVHQSMEAFIHNMNTIHSRGGNQVVFSSINYGTDTSAEGRCIIRELLISTNEGVGNGSTAIFPIQIWKKKRGVSYLPEDKNHDLYLLSCKVAARRFFPNFVNLDATYNQHEKWDENDPKRYLYEVATMGCRTRVFENRFGEKTSIARGNLSFSTINIVRLAIECMRQEPPHRALFQQAGRTPRNHRQTIVRPIRFPEDRPPQAVPAAHVFPLDRMRKVGTKRHGGKCHQPRYIGYRLYRLGGMFDSLDRKASWRERRGTGIGLAHRDLHAGPCQRILGTLSPQLQRAGYSCRRLVGQVHPYRPQELWRNQGHYRQDLLYQLQPCAGILPLFAEAQGRGRGSIPRLDTWRTHLLHRNRRRCHPQPASHHGYCRFDGQEQHRLLLGEP